MFTSVLTSISAAASDPQAAGVFDWVNEKTASTQTAIHGILIVIGLLAGLIIAWRGKSVGSVVMGILVGGLIAALPTLIGLFGNMAKEEVAAVGYIPEMVSYAHATITTRV